MFMIVVFTYHKSPSPLLCREFGRLLFTYFGTIRVNTPTHNLLLLPYSHFRLPCYHSSRMYNDNMSEDDNDWGELTLPPVEFTDCLKRLPATAPVNHAHIIDLNSYKLEMEDEGYDVKVWDAVMTMLFNISEQTINDFLDSKIKTFQLVQEFDGSSSSTKLVIWRQGGQALVCPSLSLQLLPAVLTLLNSLLNT
jgi:hypothetical protein